MIRVALTGEWHHQRRHLVPSARSSPRSPAVLTAVPFPARHASRRRRRYPGWRVAAPPPPDAIAERINRVRPADAAGPVTADPHARIVHSSGKPVQPPSRNADALGPPAQEPGGTIDLHTRDAPPYRCGQLQPAPTSRTAKGISDLCRVIGGWRAEYPDRIASAVAGIDSPSASNGGCMRPAQLQTWITQREPRYTGTAHSSSTLRPSQGEAPDWGANHRVRRHGQVMPQNTSDGGIIALRDPDDDDTGTGFGE
jgi:hypothetical protein